MLNPVPGEYGQMHVFLPPFRNEIKCGGQIPHLHNALFGREEVR